MEFRHASDVRYHIEDVIRSFPLAASQSAAPVVRAEGDEEPEDGRTVVGYPVVFNTWTEIDSWDGPFLERIDPKAANKTLADRFDKIQFMFNHGFNFALEQTPIGKYRSIIPDERGAWAEARALPAGTHEMVDTVLELIRMGAIFGQSFRFSVINEEWNDEPGTSKDNPRGIPERTIKEFRWFESGPVTYPAYEATTVALRNGEPFAVRSREEFTLWCEARNVDPIAPKPWRRPTAARAAAIRIAEIEKSRVA